MHLRAITRAGAIRSLALGTRLGRGAEGEIYLDSTRKGFVIKKYKAPTSTLEQKIRAMLENEPNDIVQKFKGHDVIQLTWPQEIVYESGRFIGFTMREIDKNNARQLNAVFDADSRNRNQYRQDYQFRVYAARNLSAIVSRIHRAGHWFIDAKPENILLDRQKGFVCVIDCDGLSICKNKFPAATATVSYVPPECQDPSSYRPQFFDERQARFGLAS